MNQNQDLLIAGAFVMTVTTLLMMSIIVLLQGA